MQYFVMVCLFVKLIGARHLSKSGRGVVSPFVEVELYGHEFTSDRLYRKTKTIRKFQSCVSNISFRVYSFHDLVCNTEDNGLNPIWSENFEFEVPSPDTSMIRFVVQDEDMFGDPNFIGQASYPVCFSLFFVDFPGNWIFYRYLDTDFDGFI